MTEDTNGPVVLTNVENEAQAALVVAALERSGIDAQTTGALTSGLRAESPGDVHILVRAADAERAAGVLSEVRALEDDEDNE